MPGMGIEPVAPQTSVLKDRIHDYVDESLNPNTGHARQDLLVTSFSTAAHQLARSDAFDAIQALEGRVGRVTPVTTQALKTVTQLFERWASPRVVYEVVQRIELADKFLAQFSQHPQPELAQLQSIRDMYFHLRIKD